MMLQGTDQVAAPHPRKKMPAASPRKKAPAKAAAPAPAPAHPPVYYTNEVVKSQPRSVEIRIDGKLKLANQCYDPTFEVTGDRITFTADVNPTWIERQLPKPTRFTMQDDPRDGEEIIHRVHSGRRDIAQTQPPTEHVLREES
jgi:hypothetical protein